MPLLDMPLDQLHQYQGRNPKPADFDAYWQRGLDELARTKPAPNLVSKQISADFAECFELRFKGTGEGEVYAQYLRPKGRTHVPCLLMFHGYTWHSGDWSEKLAWVARGFAVAAMDCRGQGGNSHDLLARRGNTHSGHIIRGIQEDNPDRLYYRDVFLDTAMLARVVSDFDEVDETRLGATGGSQGGGLTLACAALAPIKRAAATFPFLCDYQRVWEMDLAKNAYGELKEYFKRFDPRHENEAGFFTKLGYIDLQYLVPRISGELLMAVGLMDDICPPSTQFAAYNKVTAPKSLTIYPDHGHEGLPGLNDRYWEFFQSL